MKSFRLWLALIGLVLVACSGAPPAKPASPRARAEGAGAQVALSETARGAAAGYAPDDWGGLEVAPGELIPVTRADPTWGNPSAPVTIVEFGDLECHFCAKAAITLLALREMYGPDKLRIVWKHKPLEGHDHAAQAANLGAAIFALGGNEAFFTYVDGIYSGLLNLPASRDYSQLAIESAARAAERAPDRIGGSGLRDTADGAGAAKVQADVDLSEKLGVSGTPAFFVNGVHIAGAQPLERFQAVIDDELELAKRATAAGVAPTSIYAERLADNVKNGRDEHLHRPAPAKTAAKVPDDAVWRVPIGTSPVRGKPTALVTLVVFADFQCPFCRKSSATVEELRKKYGDDLRIVFKHNPLPFHDRADDAAEVSIEAYKKKGNAAFWQVHDALFAATGKLDDAELARVAVAAGIDGKAALAAASKKKHRAVIDDDQGLADELDATGTPTFFVNGKRLVGAQSLEKFSELIDAELSTAKAQVASGTPATKVYDALMKDARGGDLPDRKTAPKVTQANPVRGAKGAVTIQVFSDFQCPFCQRVEPTLSDLEKSFPGQIRVVWRNRPLAMHENAEEAAEAALEARKQKGDAGFWKMHDLLFADQAHLDRAGLEEKASQAGLDLPRFREALEKGTHKAEVEADAKIADDLGIDATPGILVNDVFVSGAQPLPKFKQAVRLALGKKK